MAQNPRKPRCPLSLLWLTAFAISSLAIPVHFNLHRRLRHRLPWSTSNTVQKSKPPTRSWVSPRTVLVPTSRGSELTKGLPPVSSPEMADPGQNPIPPGRGSSQPAPTAGVPSINKPSDVQSLGTRPPIHSRSNLATGEGITMPLPSTSTNLPKRSASSPTSWTFALPPSPTGSGWPRNSTRSTPRGTTT